MATENQIHAALRLMHAVCHDKEGWEFSESEPLSNDEWGADLLLTFFRQDYVVCHVGMRQETPIYVLQRIA